jgi:hypothetical protein
LVYAKLKEKAKLSCLPRLVYAKLKEKAKLESFIKGGCGVDGGLLSDGDHHST